MIAWILFGLSVLFIGLAIYYYTLKDLPKLYSFTGAGIVCSVASMLIPEGGSKKDYGLRAPGDLTKADHDALRLFRGAKVGSLGTPSSAGKRRRRR
jgi:zinc transporter ZupT